MQLGMEAGAFLRRWWLTYMEKGMQCSHRRRWKVLWTDGSSGRETDLQRQAVMESLVGHNEDFVLYSVSSRQILTVIKEKNDRN